jgi:hypothetical protein
MASWYALTTQMESAGLTPSSRAMVGRLTLAMAPSRTDMAMASQTVSTDQ